MVHHRLILMILFFLPLAASGHPTGNMTVVGSYVYWSYIYPVDDPSHHACVMRWTEGAEPDVWVTSDYPSSDFLISVNDDALYLLERRYENSTDKNFIRILKSVAGRQPAVIWDWFHDTARIGSGGFHMLSDDEMLFAAYPSIRRMRKGGAPTNAFPWFDTVNGIRSLGEGRFLATGEEYCWRFDLKGRILQCWGDLTDPNAADAPLDRNSIFDAYYADGELLLAYWGGRSFVLIDRNGERETLVQLEPPLTAHWVARGDGFLYLFASAFVMDGSPPVPHLLRMERGGGTKVLWSLVD